jgi:protein-S-isoprenylcysteine O-methyltransferase Ste14
MKKGPKDYLFVGVQFLLLAAFPLPILRGGWVPHEALELPAQLLMALGVFVIVRALVSLNKSLSVFPSPTEGSVLVQSGLYKYIRHPIYTGIMFLVFGWALKTGSVFQLVLALALTGLFVLKARYEERRLIAHYPDYKAYQDRTGMFFP